MDSINDLFSALTPDDIQALKETAETFFGDNTSHNNKQTNNNGFNLDRTDPETFMKIGKIISAMNSDGDKKCHLIEALKPNLSPQRQHKADKAIQMMKIIDILPMIKDLNINRND